MFDEDFNAGDFDFIEFLTQRFADFVRNATRATIRDVAIIVESDNTQVLLVINVNLSIFRLDSQTIDNAKFYLCSQYGARIYKQQKRWLKRAEGII